jgi:peptidoglycan/LPS O-acetylase OafA/YrhL
MDFCFRQKYSDFSWGFWLSLFTFTFNWFVIFKAEAMKLAGHWGVMWSLAVEEQFYLGYPLVLRLLKTRRRALFFLLLVILFGVLFRAWVYFENIGGFGMSQIASFAAFDQIAIGAAAFLMQDQFEKEARRIPWLRILFLCAGLALFMAVYTETAARSMGDWILSPTILALSCALMILGGSRDEWFKGSFWKLISWPGKFSYGCYLLHMTALFIFWNVYGQINPFAALSLFMISTWLLAYLSYRYFEVPANVRIRAAFNIKSSRTF